VGIRNLGGKTLVEIEEKLAAYLNDLEDLPIKALDLSIRVHLALERAGVTTIGQLVQMSSAQILDIRNMGEKSLTEIKGKLNAYLIDCTPPSVELPALDEPAFALPWVEIEDLPVKTLDLSTKVRRALERTGITTIGQLVQTSSAQILDIRNVGEKSLAEIKEKLKPYLVDNTPSPVELPAPDESASTVPLVDPDLLSRAMQAPLDDILVDRLALPSRWLSQVHRYGIESVGQLVQQSTDTFSLDSPVSKQLNRYLAWLAEQDETTWFGEVVGLDISPLHRLDLAEVPLEDMINRWLSSLESLRSFDNRYERVVRWRYGLDGDILTLEEVGRHLDVTRERVRQIQRRAMVTLGTPKSRALIRHFVALLIYLLKQSGGLMNEAQIDAMLREELTVGHVNLSGVVHLVCESDSSIRWLPATRAWGLEGAQLKELTGVQERLVQVLKKEHVPLPLDDVIARFKTTRFYQNRQEALEDSFLVACLRVHPDILIEDNEECGLERWKRHRTGEIILALRELGEPAHYEVIAEKTNSLLDPQMRTSAHNIHAILGRRIDLFARVGHGIFGLREWGLVDDGSLSNAACRVLSEAGKPLHYDIITDCILETWQVRRESVYAALQSDDRFICIGPGIYWLREQIAERTEVEEETDFGDLFGKRLGQWQKELAVEGRKADYDTHAEADSIRQTGVDFFK
jgi:hypothetical protein